MDRHDVTKAFGMIAACISIVGGCIAQDSVSQRELDKRVEAFLQENEGTWRDLNVPYEDGQVLHDLIIDNGYTAALEIGTSTGHSTVWIAWALSKTDGKLVTIELDESRQRQAKANVEAAGLSEFVDFRLGNAHELVPKVQGPIDFVFSDADKDWYIQYFKDVDPKLKKGGTFTAHNVLQSMDGITEYLEFVNAQQEYDTHIDKTSSSGIAISRKK